MAKYARGKPSQRARWLEIRRTPQDSLAAALRKGLCYRNHRYVAATYRQVDRSQYTTEAVPFAHLAAQVRKRIHRLLQ